MGTGWRGMGLTRAEPEINIDIYDPETSTRTASIDRKGDGRVLTSCRNTSYQVRQSGLESSRPVHEQE